MLKQLFRSSNVAHSNKWLVFVLVAIAQFMVVLDSAITNVALPTIKSQLHFSSSSIQWVITAYALTFGGFLLLGGRAADLFGRRRTLLTGMIAFTAFSFLIGVSHSATLLIVLRALQGASAALMSPSALSIVLTTFRDGGPDRNKALAYWTLVATGGAAVGLLLGGVLTQYVGWRWNFFINVPVGIVMAAAIAKFVPQHAREEAYTGLDLPGAVLVTTSLIATVLAFSQASTWGWGSGKTIGILIAAAVLMAGFIFNESRSEHPLVPLKIFKIRNVTGANLMMAPIYATMLGNFFLITLYLQNVLHYAPVKTGLAFLPFPILLGFMSSRTPKLVARFGFKRFLVIGPIFVATAMLWLSRLPVNGNYFTSLLPAFILIPIGMGLTFMPLIAAATSGVPGREAGLASGLISTSQQMGGALGLAILSGIAVSATKAATHLAPVAALVHGYDRAMLLGLVFMIFAVLLAITVIKQPKKPQSAPTDHDTAKKLHPVLDV
jgi:EmrB/QacA subfamily drug resistance transporter